MAQSDDDGQQIHHKHHDDDQHDRQADIEQHHSHRRYLLSDSLAATRSVRAAPMVPVCSLIEDAVLSNCVAAVMVSSNALILLVLLAMPTPASRISAK